MRRGPAVALLVVLGAAFGGCTSDEPRPYRPAVTAVADRASTGEELYLRDCAWCHGSTGDGTDYGPPVTEVGAASFDFYLSTGRMPLIDPEDTSERSSVEYSRAEIDAIVEHSRTLTEGPDVPFVDPDAGDVGRGASLYLQACAQCHSTTGTGSTLTRGRTIPDVLHVDATQIAEAMLVGPGHMPKFGVDTFDRGEVDSIVRFILTLDDEESSRGGFALGKRGPVTEGIIAWLIGGLLLVGVIRLIGTREDR